jgi:hypothetical protein
MVQYITHELAGMQGFERVRRTGCSA